MRVWCSSDGQASAAGKWIWKNKVIGSTFKRSPKLLAHIRQKYFRRLVDQAGNLIGDILTIPQGCPIPFIRRLTKGVLYSFHPDYDYFSDFFWVDYQPPKPETFEAVDELVSKMPQVAKGEGVFRVWHDIEIPERRESAFFSFSMRSVLPASTEKTLSFSSNSTRVMQRSPGCQNIYNLSRSLKVQP